MKTTVTALLLCIMVGIWLYGCAVNLNSNGITTNLQTTGTLAGQTDKAKLDTWTDQQQEDLKAEQRDALKARVDLPSTELPSTNDDDEPTT